MYTFAMVKSDAIKRGSLSAILYDIKDRGFVIKAEQFRWLNTADVEFLYAAHLDKPYFPNLWESVRRGAYLMALSSTNITPDLDPTVARWRKHMAGTLAHRGANLRDKYGRAKELPADNALHGSDSPERAAQEIAYFFPKLLETKEADNVR